MSVELSRMKLVHWKYSDKPEHFAPLKELPVKQGYSFCFSVFFLIRAQVLTFVYLLQAHSFMYHYSC